MAITKISSGVIAGNAIIAAGVAENAISSSEIASNAVGTTQINAGAVTSAKLDTNIDIAGTLDVTGVLTADSNVVIAGNLTVNGTTVTNSATNTTIEDALIELGTGTTGSPANDAGIVIERGDSDNAFIGWDESADTFIVGTGSFTGASTGDLTISTAPLSTGALTASGLAYPTSDGSANQVLITNGSGTLSFSSLPIDGAVVSNYTATGDGSTVAFDTGINPQNEVNTWVFVGGVYQPKNTYSYSGSTITFSEAPANGEDIDITTGQVAGFDSAETVLGVYQATTTATDTYDTGLTASNENNTFVFLDGVYQPKTSYTFSGSTITFDANTPAGMLLEVMATKTLSASAVTTSTIAANAVTSAKIASDAVLTRHIAANAITGAEISSTSQITASTFTGALTGNVTGNVTGNLTGTVQTAAQTNITSVGTLSSLAVSGDLTVDTNTLYVDSTNNRVGIGTTSPQEKLHIFNSAATWNQYANIRMSTESDSYAAEIGFHRGTSDDTDRGLFLSGDGTNKHVRVLHGGNVGIGTTNPSTKLDISVVGGMARVGGAAGNNLLQAYTGSVGAGIWAGGQTRLYTTGSMTLSTGATLTTSAPTGYTDAVTIDSSGNVGIGTNSPSAELHVKAASGFSEIYFQGASSTSGSYLFDNGTESGIYKVDSGYMAFGTGNTERMRITSSGNVGIGTSSPASTLDVAGNIVTTNGAGTTYNQFANSGNDVIWENRQNGNIIIRSNSSTERMRITSAGQVAVGTSGYGTGVLAYYRDLGAPNWGMNVTENTTYNDNSGHTFSSKQNTHGVIYIKDEGGNNGFAAIPFYPNAGGGIAYQWSILDPDSATWSSGAPSITVNLGGTSGLGFGVTFAGGSGVITITRTSGSQLYRVVIMEFAQT